MPPRRRATAVPLDVELTRQQLAAGKIVRVGISRSAQFPEGAIGRVRGIGDPAVDGDEYVQVELTLGGTRDVVPFTPADLTPATRGRRPAEPAPDVAKTARPNEPANGARGGPGSARRNTAAAARPQSSPASPPSESVLFATSATVGPAAGPLSGPSPAGATPAASQPAVSPSRPLRDVVAATASQPAVSQPAVSQPTRTPKVGPAPEADLVNPPARPTSKSARGVKRPPGVTITIATTDTEPTTWRIEARVGSRVALRAGAVTPARVWELVQLLQNETLSRAVGAILTEQRSAAQARATVLAAELAAVRAELDALPDAGNT